MLDEHGFITEQRYSQWQKKKVKTIVVNCRAKNPTLRSIANAINIAKPYDRIELTEGEYQESFTVNFPLEIVSADGEEAQIITRNSGITVTAAVELYIENLTIISKSSSKLDAAVVFMAGNPVMFRCKISSLIMGGTSRSHVENCVITESSAGVGVVVQDNAGGTIQSTTVHSHSRACLEIDTRGELKVVECQLYNYRNWEGDVVVVSGAISSVARDTTVGTHLACSKVEIAQCQIYLSNQDDNRRRSSAHQAYGSSPAGSYCVNINSGAAPTFSQNELIEGEIGFLLDGAGPAQLKGNVVRCQRKSGILAYIEDEHVYAIDKTNFCIKGDNIFDRCHIGIDVQASSNRTQSFDSLLSNDTPSTKHVFRWSNVNSLKPLSTPVTTTLERDFSLVHHGELTRLSAIKQNLNTLATCVLEAYPTCLQHSFNTNSVGVGGSVRPSNQNVFAELLNTSLQTTLDQADSREEAVRNMDHFRGNRGIDIINTKFSNCSICAIRFGRQGYGRVEDCVFEDSGTHAIVVDCGAHPLITGCRFLRSRKASIVIANFANPLIIGNEISGGLVMAMVITRLGRGVVLGNIISGNHGCGIVVENSSQPLICANLISSNRTGGAVVENFCDPLIVFNQFSANISSQIVCSQSSDAFIAYNSIQSSPDYGVKIVSLSRCYLAMNTITLNGDGVMVELDADPVVEYNTIQQSLRSGVLVCNNGLGCFSDNTISLNSGACVLVQDGASPTFRRNTIQKGIQGGVIIIREGCGTFEFNTISENSVANVLLADSYTNPTFYKNCISNSFSGCGVIAAKRAGGVFKSNSIFQNKLCGVYVLSEGAPVFKYNTISREAIGVIVSENGKGEFTENEITSCSGSGVLSQREGEPAFRRNKISQCSMSGIQVAPDGLGDFSENEIFENDIGLHLGTSMKSSEVDVHSSFLEEEMTDSSSSLPVNPRRASVFSPNGRKSVLSTYAISSAQRRASSLRPSQGKVCNNQIYENHNGGVLIDANAHCEVEGNTIFKNKKYGIRGDLNYARKRANKILGEKLFHDNLAPPKAGASKVRTSADLRRNKVYSHTKANVFFNHFPERFPVSLEENDMYNAPMGIYVGNHSILPYAGKNHVHHCYEGLHAEESGQGEFSGNHFDCCQYAGVYIASDANPVLSDGNVMENCGICGCMIDAGGRGVIQKSVMKKCNIGVIVFTGPASAFSLSYDELVKANMVTSCCEFVENTIEENECHGVLVCSVISSCPLRTPLRQQKEEVLEDHPHFEYRPYQGPQRSLMGSEERLNTLFKGNVIQKNRLFGVYHDRFEHWDLRLLNASSLTASPAMSPKKIKNAYGGYEVLLGTSQLLASPDHIRQRELKQISFVENTIQECSVGFGAGYGCHPFLLRNKIVKNTFIGLLLRFGSAVMSSQCEISGNGLMGVYAASGAKGQVTSGVIKNNNTLSRPVNSPHDSRNFSACTVNNSYLAVNNWTTAVVIENSESFTKGTFRSYEQLHNLVDVHLFTVTNGLQVLGELAAASSGGMWLASGSCPSSLHSAERNSNLGGLAVEHYMEISAADGGMGAWIEDGSRVVVKENRIEDHKNFGVFISKGILHHHKTLHGSYHMETQAGKNGVKSVFSGGAGTLETPPLATMDTYVLFTPGTLCASGLVAARQVANRNEMTVDLAESTHNSFVFPTSEEDTSRDYDAEQQRNDSIHHALVANNEISANRCGVFTELLQVVQAADLSKMPAAAPVASDTLTPDDASSLDWQPADLDYVVVVEGNTVSNNKCGIQCHHIVELRCGVVVASRAQLNETVSRDYETVRADLMLNKQVQYPTSLPFSLAPVREKVSNAHILRNEIYNNLQSQGVVTSRYVVIARDQSRTLLQFDTLADPQTSSYCSKVLLALPQYASLLQMPPPGLFLWQGNLIRDSHAGIKLYGLLGSNSVRFRGNVFRNITEDSVLLEGHMTAATVGEGNKFDNVNVGIHTNTVITPTIRLPNYPSSPIMDFQTRIFKNTFMNCKDTAVLLHTQGESTRTLVCRNEFTRFGAGSCGVFLTHEAKVLLSTNVFKDSHIPVVVGLLKPKLHTTLCEVRLVENYFNGNYIGCLVCNGGAPVIEKNLFESNSRCGLEIVGANTSPKIRQNTFRNNNLGKDDLDGSGTGTLSRDLAASIGRQLDHGAGYPEKGKLLFHNGAVTVPIVPGNTNVTTAVGFSTLPAGLLVGPETEGLIEQCMFELNDIGIDVVRDACYKDDEKRSTYDGLVTVKGCVFRTNNTAGVLVRAPPAPPVTTKEDPLAKTTRSVSLNNTLRPGSPLASGVKVVGTLGTEMPVETTILTENFFYSNVSDQNVGDVIAMDSGYATFKRNVFYGTVHVVHHGIAFFTENTFLPLSDERGNMPAVLLHENSRGRFEANCFYHCKTGVQSLPVAGGRIIQNKFVGCVMGASLAPYSDAVVSSNYMWKSTDCAIMAYSGIVNENEIVESPAGIIVQDPSVYKAINAVPAKLRRGLALTISQNTVSFCSGDGLLVTCSGKFEENHLSRCKVGVNVVSPPTAGSEDDLPMVKSNFVYDCGVGVYMDNKSMSRVVDNDIFDNDEIGVIVMPSAAGFLQGNRISSAKDHGAVEIPNDSRVKSISNTIRNQVSPAFNRGVRVTRVKEYEVRLQKLSADIAEMDDQILQLNEKKDFTNSNLSFIMEELIRTHSQPVKEVSTTMTGQAARALRRISVRPIAFDDDRPFSANKPPKAPASTTKARASSYAASARKKAQPRDANAKGKITKTVLIHVLAGALNREQAFALGTSVAKVLAMPPLSKMNLVSNITTTASQLKQFLAENDPAISIVVADKTQKQLGEMDRSTLLTLHNKIGSSPVADGSNVAVVLLHKSFVEDSISFHTDGMSLSQFAAEYKTVQYKNSVDQCLDELQTALSEEINRSGPSAAGVVLDDLGADMTYNEFTVVSPTSYSGKAGKSSPGLRSPVESAPDTKLTRERLGSLMNLITPEALGYSETPKKKGRKKSVAAGSRKPSVKPSSRTGSSKAKSSRASISTNSSAGNKSRKTSVKR